MTRHFGKTGKEAMAADEGREARCWKGGIAHAVWLEGEDEENQGAEAMTTLMGGYWERENEAGKEGPRQEGASRKATTLDVIGLVSLKGRAAKVV